MAHDEFRIDGPRDAAHTIVLAHGAGAAMDSPFMNSFAEGLAGRGIRVREVPLDRIAESITARTTLVAVSAVQSADGRVADLDALHAASGATGARVLLDTTQAVGWLPVDASRFAYTACGGYKWLLSPRGTAYFTINPTLIDDLTPHYAG